MAAALAVVFLHSCVIPPWIEARYWKDRNQSVALPPPALPLPAATRTMGDRFSGFSAFPSEKVAPLVRTGDADPLLHIPYAFGRIQRVLPPAPGRKNPLTVVHIQDVHKNEEAQRNIASAIQFMIDRGRVDGIALEGTAETLNLERFRRFPRRETIRAVADYMLKEHRISGPVHAGMVSPTAPPSLIGVDDPLHHQANVEAYRRSAAKQSDLRDTIVARKNELAARKDRAFNVDLRRYDRLVESFHDKKISLGDFLRTAEESGFIRPTASEKYASLRRFLQALRIEESIDFRQVESERGALIGRLAPRLSPEENRRLAEAAADYRLGRMSYAAFYGGIISLCEQNGLSLGDYPALTDYIRYVSMADKIDLGQLISDLKAMEMTAFRKLATKREEMDLLMESRRLELLGKLVDFSLTPEEWKEYQEIANTHDPLDLSSFESFYREADIRSAAMVENVMKALASGSWIENGRNQSRATRHPSPVVVLVTGGFHSGDMEAMLRRRGATVITFAPRITRVENASGSDALSAFQRDKTPLEKLFEGEKLFLADAPASGLARAQMAAGAAVLESLQVRADPLDILRMFSHAPRAVTAASIKRKGAGFDVRFSWRESASGFSVQTQGMGIENIATTAPLATGGIMAWPKLLFIAVFSLFTRDGDKVKRFSAWLESPWYGVASAPLIENYVALPLLAQFVTFGLNLIPGMNLSAASPWVVWGIFATWHLLEYLVLRMVAPARAPPFRNVIAATLISAVNIVFGLSPTDFWSILSHYLVNAAGLIGLLKRFWLRQLSLPGMAHFPSNIKGRIMDIPVSLPVNVDEWPASEREALARLIRAGDHLNPIIDGLRERLWPSGENALAPGEYERFLENQSAIDARELSIGADNPEQSLLLAKLYHHFKDNPGSARVVDSPYVVVERDPEYPDKLVATPFVDVPASDGLPVSEHLMKAARELLLAAKATERSSLRNYIYWNVALLLAFVPTEIHENTTTLGDEFADFLRTHHPSEQKYSDVKLRLYEALNTLDSSFFAYNLEFIDSLADSERGEKSLPYLYVFRKDAAGQRVLDADRTVLAGARRFLAGLQEYARLREKIGDPTTRDIAYEMLHRAENASDHSIAINMSLENLTDAQNQVFTGTIRRKYRRSVEPFVRAVLADPKQRRLITGEEAVAAYIKSTKWHEQGHGEIDWSSYSDEMKSIFGDSLTILSELSAELCAALETLSLWDGQGTPSEEAQRAALSSVIGELYYFVCADHIGRYEPYGKAFRVILSAYETSGFLVSDARGRVRLDFTRWNDAKRGIQEITREVVSLQAADLTGLKPATARQRLATLLDPKRNPLMPKGFIGHRTRILQPIIRYRPTGDLGARLRKLRAPEQAPQKAATDSPPPAKQPGWAAVAVILCLAGICVAAAGPLGDLFNFFYDNWIWTLPFQIKVHHIDIVLGMMFFATGNMIAQSFNEKLSWKMLFANLAFGLIWGFWKSAATEATNLYIPIETGFLTALFRVVVLNGSQVIPKPLYFLLFNNQAPHSFPTINDLARRVVRIFSSLRTGISNLIRMMTATISLLRDSPESLFSELAERARGMLATISTVAKKWLLTNLLASPIEIVNIFFIVRKLVPDQYYNFALMAIAFFYIIVQALVALHYPRIVAFLHPKWVKFTAQVKKRWKILFPPAEQAVLPKVNWETKDLPRISLEELESLGLDPMIWLAQTVPEVKMENGAGLKRAVVADGEQEIVIERIRIPQDRENDPGNPFWKHRMKTLRADAIIVWTARPLKNGGNIPEVYALGNSIGGEAFSYFRWLVDVAWRFLTGNKNIYRYGGLYYWNKGGYLWDMAHKKTIASVEWPSPAYLTFAIFSFKEIARMRFAPALNALKAHPAFKDKPWILNGHSMGCQVAAEAIAHRKIPGWDLGWLDEQIVAYRFTDGQIGGLSATAFVYMILSGQFFFWYAMAHVWKRIVWPFFGLGTPDKRTNTTELLTPRSMSRIRANLEKASREEGAPPFLFDEAFNPPDEFLFVGLRRPGILFRVLLNPWDFIWQMAHTFSHPGGGMGSADLRLSKDLKNVFVRLLKDTIHEKAQPGHREVDVTNDEIAALAWKVLSEGGTIREARDAIRELYRRKAGVVGADVQDRDPKVFTPHDYDPSRLGTHRSIYSPGRAALWLVLWTSGMAVIIAGGQFVPYLVLLAAAAAYGTFKHIKATRPAGSHGNYIVPGLLGYAALLVIGSIILGISIPPANIIAGGISFFASNLLVQIYFKEFSLKNPWSRKQLIFNAAFGLFAGLNSTFAIALADLLFPNTATWLDWGLRMFILAVFLKLPQKPFFHFMENAAKKDARATVKFWLYFIISILQIPILGFIQNSSLIPPALVVPLIQLDTFAAVIIQSLISKSARINFWADRFLNKLRNSLIGSLFRSNEPRPDAIDLTGYGDFKTITDGYDFIVYLNPDCPEVIKVARPQTEIHGLPRAIIEPWRFLKERVPFLPRIGRQARGSIGIIVKWLRIKAFRMRVPHGYDIAVKKSGLPVIPFRLAAEVRLMIDGRQLTLHNVLLQDRVPEEDKVSALLAGFVHAGNVGSAADLLRSCFTYFENLEENGVFDLDIVIHNLVRRNGEILSFDPADFTEDAKEFIAFIQSPRFRATVNELRGKLDKIHPTLAEIYLNWVSLHYNEQRTARLMDSGKRANSLLYLFLKLRGTEQLIGEGWVNRLGLIGAGLEALGILALGSWFTMSLVGVSVFGLPSTFSFALPIIGTVIVPALSAAFLALYLAALSLAHIRLERYLPRVSPLTGSSEVVSFFSHLHRFGLYLLPILFIISPVFSPMNFFITATLVAFSSHIGFDFALMFPSNALSQFIFDIDRRTDFLGVHRTASEAEIIADYLKVVMADDPMLSMGISHYSPEGKIHNIAASFARELKSPLTRWHAKRIFIQELHARDIPVDKTWLMPLIREMAQNNSSLTGVKTTVFVPPSEHILDDIRALSLLAKAFGCSEISFVVEKSNEADIRAWINRNSTEGIRIECFTVLEDSFEMRGPRSGRLRLDEDKWDELAKRSAGGSLWAMGDIKLEGFHRNLSDWRDQPRNIWKLFPNTDQILQTILNLESIAAILTAA